MRVSWPGFQERQPGDPSWLRVRCRFGNCRAYRERVKPAGTFSGKGGTFNRGFEESDVGKR